LLSVVSRRQTLQHTLISYLDILNLFEEPDPEFTVRRDQRHAWTPCLEISPCSVRQIPSALQRKASTRAKAKADHNQLRRPRPAQVIPLADFGEQGADAWTHACRCGGAYAITGAEMDRGVHLIPCTGCSEVVWVGYELAEEE
jgi:hypothetical protein